MSSILINIGITIIIIISSIVIYNIIMKQPIFSIPWSNENTILKNNITQNISELQNQIDKLSGTSNTDINYIKDNIIPSIQKTLEKTIEDTKKINLISNKELQKQIDDLNNLLLSTKKTIEDSNTSNNSDLQNQIKTFSDNLQSSIDKLSENTSSDKQNLQKQIDDILSIAKKSIEDSNNELQTQLKLFSDNLQSSIDKLTEKTSFEQENLQKQIDAMNDLNKLNVDEIKLKIIPSVKESIEILENIIKNADDKITQNKNDLLSELNKLKNNIQSQIESQTIDTQKSIDDIKNTLDNLKNETKTKTIIINTYTKDGTQIQWTIKGDDNGNLCISDEKNVACIDRESGFLFNGKKS